jgi:hypothetical protein
LDSTGVRDWSFVNPRSPFPLVRAVSRADQKDIDDKCFANQLQTVNVHFENQTSDRDFEVTLPFVLPSLAAQKKAVRGAWKGIEQRCRDLNLVDAVQTLQGASGTEAGKTSASVKNAETAKMVESIDTQAKNLEEMEKDLQTRLEDLAVLARREELALEVHRRSDKSTAASTPYLDALRQDIAASKEELERMEAGKENLKVLEQLKDQEIVVNPMAKREEQLSQTLQGYQLRNLKENLRPVMKEMGVANEEDGPLDLKPLQSACTQWMSAPPAFKKTCMDAVDAFTSEAGSDSDLLAELNKQIKDLKSCLDQAEATKDASLLALLSDFRSQRKSINRYDILISSREAPGTKSFKEICKAKDSDNTLCDYAFTVNRGQTVTLDGEVLAVLEPGRITFNVAFAGEADPPAHKQGYFATARSFKETDSRTEWTFATSLGGGLSPRASRVLKVPDSQPEKFYTSGRFSADQPYSGDRSDGWTGSGSLALQQTLGDRAQGSATVSFKKGALGENNSGSASVSNYTVTIFGDNFRQLRLGKYDLLTTREAISGSLSGESFELIFRSLSLGALIRANRTESVNVTAKSITLPERAVTVQLQNIPFSQNRVLRTWTLLGLYGDERGNSAKLPDLGKGGTFSPKAPFRYATLGTDMTFGLPDAVPGGTISGAFSLYGNRRWLIAGVENGLPERIRKGSGAVGLFTLRWSAKTQTGEPPPSTLEARLGYGTGDDPKTSDRDEGYLGEGGSYAPDLLFLSRFAGNIGVLDEAKRPDVAAGLSNKTYFGLSYINTRTALLLEAAAALLGVREQMISRSTSLSFHHYRFNEKVFNERVAGNEMDVTFSVQVPKKVTTSLGFGYFFVGPALDKVFTEEPWIVTTQVKVSLF